MTTENHQRAKKIFSCAKGLAGSERAEFLEKSCDPDADLRREVEYLLTLDDELNEPNRRQQTRR